jgi:hypothetical protein
MEEDHIQCYIEHVPEHIGKESSERGRVCGRSGDRPEQGSSHPSTKDTTTLHDATRILRYIEDGL